MLAVDFDNCPNVLNKNNVKNPMDYRQESGIQLIEETIIEDKQFAFDCQWKNLLVRLREGEEIAYTISGFETVLLRLSYQVKKEITLNIKTSKEERAIQLQPQFIEKEVRLNGIGNKLETVKLSVIGGEVNLKSMNFEEV